MSQARALMFQGTGSHVGKSLIVAGLCRAYAARGLKVRPFKPQNMSNNAAVTTDGGEIGRAQALQARACGVAPTVHMNPVLLKAQGAFGAQVVVQGRVLGAAAARDFDDLTPRLLAAALDSYGRVAADADLVLIEGAGAAAEVNLRARDIANMGFARAAGVPVALIGDIDRGGVIAQIVGAKAVLAPDDAAMIVGFLVNKFRGDARLFDDGMRFIEARTGWRALGLAPFFPAAHKLPPEDAVALEAERESDGAGPIIAAPILPHIANFDDFDPLRLEPNVRLTMVRPGEPLPIADLVVLPGSKATIADLAFLRTQGWDIDLLAHARRGGRVLGICGGYQMLGRSIADLEGVEGPAGEVQGLGLLEVDTVMAGEKALRPIAGVCLANGASFFGYEMHVGRTSGRDCARPLLRLCDGREDGAISAGGRVMGAYAHGLFADDSQRAAWLMALGAPSDLAYEATVERTLDELAAHLAGCIDLEALLALAR
jgi:adenosylcobyric acid synthase